MKYSDNSYMELREQIAAAQEEVLNKARQVRRCPFCTEGYLYESKFVSGKEYGCARECECHKAYRKAGGELFRLAIKFEKSEGRELRDIITRDMTNLSAPSGPPVPAENVAELKRRFHERMMR